MSQGEIALMAHLLRRAGFGATRDELEGCVAKGYEATVEELLHPEDAPPALDHEDIIRRYHVDSVAGMNLEGSQAHWLYRMINTTRPLEEKLALFWHGVFATGFAKVNQPMVEYKQIDMFRRHGLGSFRSLLTEVSKDPAMILWLDNKDNHRDAVNENYGRELLELFSLGVGNYTEDDVRQCSRAFTGWTMRNAAYHAARASRDSTWPYGRLDWQFQFKDDDHDDDEKTFLGHTGSFNGEDIVEIIYRHPATAKFISRHMYNFFVADEPQVPAWNDVPSRDPEAINTLMDAFLKNDSHICPVLRVLFNSDFFKNATFTKVKSPTEVVVGTVRLTGSHRFPSLNDIELANQTGLIGQRLMNPPSVEGWHTGAEWIDTSSLVDRLNFAVMEFADMDKPGIRSIINRIKAKGDHVSPETMVDSCLDLIGPLNLAESTRDELVAHAKEKGELRFGSEEGARSAAGRINEMLQLVVATREYQLA